MASKGAKGRVEKQEEWKNSIRTTLILKRVQNYILAKEEDKDFAKNKMTSTQMRGAEMLLRKTLPDLKAIEATVDANLNVITPVLPDYLKDAD